MEAWPEGIRRLLTTDVTPVLAALGAGQIESWKPVQVSHRVGRSTTVQYRVRHRTPQARSARTSTFVVIHEPASPGDDVGSWSVDHGGVLDGWQVPHDPHLPGLATALDPVAVIDMLRGAGTSADSVQLTRRAYRAGRRAVVEATTEHDRYFLKVVRPKVVDDLAAIHHSTGRTLPVPEVLATTTSGILLLSALPGLTLRQALRSGAAPVEALPGLAEVEGLLDLLPPGVGRRARPRAAQKALARHCRTLAVVLPDTAHRLQDLEGRIVGRLDAAASDAGDRARVPVHGDLYEAQVMVRPGPRPSICGLLDLDTVGTGHRADEIANLCGHLSVTALREDPGHRPGDPTGPSRSRTAAYLGSVLSSAEEVHDRDDLRARVAARVVAMATGPFRVQEDGWADATTRRLDLAEAWMG